MSHRPVSGVLRVLLVEDERADAVLLERHLKSDSITRPVRLERCESLADARERLSRQRFDVVLLDLHLPDSQGTSTVAGIRAADAEVPIVVFTSAGDEESVIRAIHAGAQDYLVKAELGTPLLRRTIRHAIECQRMQRENERLSARLRDTERAHSLHGVAVGAAASIEGVTGEILAATDRMMIHAATASWSGRLQQEISRIRQQAQRAACMAGKLRDYASPRRTQIGRLDLAQFVVQTSERLESMIGRNVDLQLDLEHDTPRVNADPAALREVLIDLVRNAGEAIGDQPGAIYVRTGLQWASPDILDASHGDRHLRAGPCAFLRVENTGQPLPDRVQKHLFDPFVTTKVVGRGLGLPAALGIVRRHEGAIHHERTEQEHTAFTVLLPCAPTVRRRRPPSRGRHGGAAAPA